MSVLIDLRGKRSGRLKVLSREGRDAQGNITWRCLCDCGAEKIGRGYLLNTGKLKSCGCLRREPKIKHGLSNHPLYIIWKGMLQRCNYKKNISYKNYGGRGIKVCDRWKEFINFYDDMVHTYKPGLTIDRIDNDGNYESGNCRWATRTQQSLNKRSFGSSGNSCVKFRKRTNKWRAYIWVKRKCKDLGSFSTKEEALNARKEYKIKLG